MNDKNDCGMSVRQRYLWHEAYCEVRVSADHKSDWYHFAKLQLCVAGVVPWTNKYCLYCCWYRVRGLLGHFKECVWVSWSVWEQMHQCCFQFHVCILRGVFWCSVYTGTDPFGTGTKLVRIRLVFTRELVGQIRIESAIWYQMVPLMKVIPYGTVPFQYRTGPV